MKICSRQYIAGCAVTKKLYGQKVLASYPVDLIENLVEHAKLTRLTDIFYERDSKENLRNFMFNQIPYVHIKGDFRLINRCIITSR